MTLDPWSLFLFAGAMVLLVASPGPFVAAISARSAALGMRAGTAMALGACLSEGVWVVTALLGLGAIAVAHEGALAILRYLGAAWLIWIGLNLIFARHSLMPAGGAPIRREPFWRGFATGALLNFGNPKTALFYMTIFPGFFDIAALSWLDALIILAIAVPIGLISDLGYVSAAATMGRRISGGRTARRLDQASGGVLAGAGAAIAAT
ncbi:MAG: LysE family translocator [Pseudomonadota bacterium]